MFETRREKIGIITFLIEMIIVFFGLAILLQILGDGDIFNVANISLELVGMIMVAILGSVAVTEPVNEQRRVIFHLFLLSESVMLMVDVLFWFTFEQKDSFLSESLWSVAQCIQIVVYMFFLFYVYVAYIGWGRNSVWLIRSIVATLILAVFFGVTNSWTGWAITFDDSGMLIRGIGHYIVVFILFVQVLITVYALSRRTDYDITRILLILVLILPLFGFFLQGIVNRISFTIVFLAYGSVLIYSAGFVVRGKEIESNRDQQDRQYAEALTSQIAPHFMFNSLSSIMNLPDNNDESREAIEVFSSYLRNTLDSIMLTTPIPISREIEQVQTFVELRKFSYGERLNVTYELRDTGFSIPSLTIRTIISNFIRDNLDSESEPLQLTVVTDRTDDGHRVTINNVLGTDTTRRVFRDLQVNPSKSVIAERVEMLCSGHITHRVGDGESVAIIIDIPEAS